MKNRIGLVVLVLVCLGLGIGLVAIKKQSSEQQRQDADRIEALSNKWVKTSADLDEQKQFAATLEKDLETQKKALAELTNNFTQVSAKLTTTEDSLKSSQAELDKSKARIGQLENENRTLEAQNQQLDQKAIDLSTALTNLTVQIADTQKKLAASEGDKAFLEKELKRLMSEKAELERQFNDLTVLRAQVAKLKEELNIARRIEWIRQGIFAASETKGATKLMQGFNQPQLQAKAAKPAYDLNVEVSADGSVKVIPPQTNSATAK